ncbi:class I SAM-dependent methyltransferase [Geothrix fuzhouensis]|uniref:class I SAM-dependent methyltransferase n=1 Tax=Geothrix fuzhouensis TaxID=2966451 RepID=UPI002147FCAC|nr:class I SAM-dependent methyltransferase [Geothrix fuzhouensis]
MSVRLGLIEAPPSLDLLGPLGPEIAPLFTRPFLTLHRASGLYTARICLLLLFDLGWETRLRSGVTLDGLCEGLPDQARKPLAWMLPFLTAEGMLTQQGDSYLLTGQPDLDLAGLREAVEIEAPGHAANFDLLDGVRSHILPFFTEGKDGDALLFDLALFPLWLAYFRNGNLGYFPNNLLTLLALREGLPTGARVLELGGGAGSFAQLVAELGAEQGWLGRIAEYRFTDVAPTFLRRAQRNLGTTAPGLPLAFQSLDLNRPLAAQGIAPASLDAIVGINVLHVAQDLEATLRDLHGYLKPEGRLVIGECLKPSLDTPLYLEFFFNFIKAFTSVKLDPRWRPRHGFLTPEAWDQALLHAGFTQILHVPPPHPLMNRHPNFTVGAMVAIP